jgi:hypothetical protein
MATHTVESAQGFLKRGWARLSKRKQRTRTAMTSGSIEEAEQQANNYQMDSHIDPSALPNRK